MKGVAPLIALVAVGVIIAGIYFVASGGFQYSVITIDEFAQCHLAQPEVLTISCEASGNAVPVSIGTGTSFVVYLSGAQVLSVSPSQEYILKDAATGAIICNSANGVSCTGTSLVTGRGYEFSKNCGFGICLSGPSTLTFTGRPLGLKLSSPAGFDRVDVPGTTNCISNDLSSSTINAIWQGTPLAKVIDGGVPRSVSLQEGQSRAFPSGVYRTLAPITTLTYDGKPAICDQFNRKLIGFQKKNAFDGTCYAIQDSGTVLLDRSTDQYFACTDMACQTVYGLSSDYHAVDFSCKRAPSNSQCIVLNDCGSTQYITNQNGQTVMREPTSCASGVCQFRETNIGCNPSIAYPNNQCCKRDLFGNYNLEACTTGLLSCDQLGTDACCLANQKDFTIKLPPAGKICCDLPKDSGIGKAVSTQAECDTLRGNGGFNPFSWFGDLFKGITDFVVVLAWFLIALIILVVLYIIAKFVGRRK